MTEPVEPQDTAARGKAARTRQTAVNAQAKRAKASTGARQVEGSTRKRVRSTAKPASGGNPAQRRTTRKRTSEGVPSSEWHAMVAQAAYFRAEQRGFVGGSPEEDWYAAEAELRARLGLQ
jgi:hypothetical protein